MIRLSDGSLFDDDAADAAYERAQRRGLVNHYAPGLHAGRLPESFASSFNPSPPRSLAGLVFGAFRKRGSR